MILSLADRLWDRVPAGSHVDLHVPTALEFSVDVRPAEGRGRPPEPQEESWVVGPEHVELSLGRELQAHIELVRWRVAAQVSARLVADEPSLVTRLLLETPAAVLLARRGYGVVHAGAVVGPAGAVVIRGAAGAGKSTLVGAAYGAGLGVLGDESVLVARSDPDDLLAAVRDVVLLPDAARLLGLEDAVTLAGTGSEKRRVDLFPSSTPAARHARRLATVLLGPRHGAPAQLEPLTPDAFLREFRDGAIPQEQWSGTPGDISAHWARHGAYRLSGAQDLAGAVELLAGLVTSPAAARRA